METTIRLGTTNDLLELSVINSFGTETGRLAALERLPRFISEGNLIVAEAHGKVVGLFYWDRSFSLGDKGDWYVQQITVDEKYRRQGIGEKLWRRFFEIAKEEGVTDIFADINDENFPSLSLAEKLGGKEVGQFNLFGGEPKRIYRFKL